MPGREGLQDERARGIVPFDQFPGPVVIPPADIQDNPGLCLRVNATWAALLSSLLDRLDQPDVWAGDDTQIDDARQRVRALQVLLDGINDCMCIDEFTASANSGSPVSVTFNPDTGNFHFVIPPGAAGPAGPTGPAGPAGGAGTSGVIVDSLPLDDMSDNPRCQVSTQLRQELETVLDDWLDVIDAQVDIAQSITGIISNAAPVIGLGVVALAEGVNTAITATTAVLRSGLTTQVYDKIQCHLHCNLDEVNPWIDNATKELWAADVYADTNIALAVRVFVYWSIRAMSVEGLQYFSWRSQFIDTPTDCGFCDCEPWSYTFTFASSAEGWALPSGQPGNTAWDSGTQSMRGTSANTNLLNVIAAVEFPVTYIRSVSMTVASNLARGYGYRGILYRSSGTETGFLTGQNPSGEHEVSVNINHFADRIRINWDSSSGGASNWGEIREVTITGFGDNPFD